MISKTTTYLFNSFPRDIGKEGKFWRTEVNNLSEFRKMIEGVGCNHVSIYDYNLTLDKVLIEIDSKSIEDSLESSKILVRNLKDEGLDFIPAFSGRRGFHFYVLFEEFQPPNKETANLLIESAQEALTTIEEDGKKKRIENVDEQVIGDSSHMIRIPNTPREETHCLCTYLPREFVEWEPTEITNWSKERHYLDYKISDLPDMRNYVQVRETQEHSYRLEVPETGQHKIPDNIEEFLHGLVRPSVIKEVQNPEPGHYVRTELVCELRAIGYDREHILDIIEKLGWSDFDRKRTWYHIQKIFDKDLKPMKTSTLRKYIEGVDSNWGYPWRLIRNE